ncbi:MAG: uroporphyrinogen III synthase [Arcobacter sp.]|nr:MAG: uroporphyrinogen III synthase [Arcobacter sp.]
MKSKIYLLSNEIYPEVENLSLFKINYIKPIVDFSLYDALVFTSKNAVYSLENFGIEWKKIPCFAISSKTANIIKEKGGNLSFTGISSHGNEFANELIPLLKNKKVLYVKAKKTVSNLLEILQENEINIDTSVVYETIFDEEHKIQNLEKNSFIIFTSPSSVKCFFDKYQWDKTFKAICIGKTTTKYLPLGVDFMVSSKTSIQECIKLAQSI